MNNELIKAAQAVVDRWDSTDWKAAPTAEVMNRLRAALSAKPEPCCGEYSTCLRACTPRGRWLQFQSTANPTKLPEVEDIEEWMQHNHRYERDGSSTKYTKVFDYVHQLIAAHAAEQANLHAKIGDLLAISATAKEQGWQEAIAAQLVDAGAVVLSVEDAQALDSLLTKFRVGYLLAHGFDEHNKLRIAIEQARGKV
jgi:hypothetical protein